ncbi:MAG: hypothetical protein AAFO06_14830, partial [Cyanobacteria bacterium J06597_16]
MTTLFKQTSVFKPTDWEGAIFLGLLLSGLVTLTGCSQTNTLNTPADSDSTITILGQFSGQQQADFEQSLVPFEEETGIDVVYEATDQFNSLLRMRIASFAEP